MNTIPVIFSDLFFFRLVSIMIIKKKTPVNPVYSLFNPRDFCFYVFFLLLDSFNFSVLGGLSLFPNLNILSRSRLARITPILFFVLNRIKYLEGGNHNASDAFISTPRAVLIASTEIAMPEIYRDESFIYICERCFAQRELLSPCETPRAKY